MKDINELMSDKRFMEYTINRCTPMSVMFDMVGNNFSYDHNIFCPFHDNEHTPSARAYKNIDGDTLFCYSERKVFRPSDFIKHELIKASLDKTFYKLWMKLDSITQQSLLDDYENKLDTINLFSEEDIELLNKFKSNELTLHEFNENLLSILRR